MVCWCVSTNHAIEYISIESIVSFAAMSDLIYLLDQLVDKDGKILITDVYKSVEPLTEDEKKLYSDIEFDTEEYR